MVVHLARTEQILSSSICGIKPLIRCFKFFLTNFCEVHMASIQREKEVNIYFMTWQVVYDGVNKVYDLRFKICLFTLSDIAST